jgi:site-specific DNA recombinase
MVIEEEAERVRLIFRRYLEVSGINELARVLASNNICTKARTFSTGTTRGGIAFGRGTLSHLLRNRFFPEHLRYRPARRS